MLANDFRDRLSNLEAPLLVLGGAHCGKSLIAPKALDVNKKTAVFGTCDPKESAFKKRVAELKSIRPPLWETIEDNKLLAEKMAGLDSSYSQILFDSLNQWIASRLLGGATKYSIEQLEEHLFNEFGFIQNALREHHRKRIVIVSSELGSGVTPPQKIPRLFRQLTCKFNCIVAEQAASVVLITAGIPMLLKGRVIEPRVGE